MQRHQPTLYSLAEDEDDNHQHPNDWISSPHVRSARMRPRAAFNRSMNSPGYDSSQRYPDIYSQFVKRYRSTGAEYDDVKDDPDYHYLQRDPGPMALEVDSEDEDIPGLSLNTGVDERAARALESEGAEPATPGDMERLEWQAMLASVLAGDVLKSEKRRIAVALESNNEQHVEQHYNTWLAIRAKLHSRSIAEERKYLDERRARIVGPSIDDITNFKAIPPEESGANSALEQVARVLKRLDNAVSLYPNLKAFYADNPPATEDTFQTRCDALNTWTTVLTNLQRHTALLRKWTGSDTLDVTQPYTSSEVPISHNPMGTRKQDGTEVADGTSFVERLLKEENMQRTFEKGSLTTAHSYIATARDAQVNLASQFRAMNLPTFEKELVPLISFPTKLAQASLDIRLGYVEKLNASSEGIILDQVTEDLKLSIGLACTLKRQNERFLSPDAEGNWNLPACISPDYDATVLAALEKLFLLIEMRLKDTSKAIYFKQTDYLDAQWATFNDVSLCTVGGSTIVAERLCGLTNRMLHRINRYFETQLQVPSKGKVPVPTTNGALGAHRDGDAPNQKMTDEQMTAWYAKILESVKLRFRKLQRFARVLSQKFNNSAEYDISRVPLDSFIAQLVLTDHFLVYTQTYEEEGIYVIASHNLRDRPEVIRRILNSAYQVAEVGGDDGEADNDDEDYEDEGTYVLVLSPCDQFLWNGMVLVHEIPKLNLGLEDNHVRLIADGTQRRLLLAKHAFTSSFLPVDEAGQPLEPVIAPFTCVSEVRAHLPGVNSGLGKIAKSANKFSNSIINAVGQVRESLINVNGYQVVLGDWFLFASEHGQHAIKHMQGTALNRFNVSLIELAINWVSFICDDCDPSDRRTFRWAVNALEFALHRTRRNSILQFPDDQFEMLRSKVASCMTLLISHFDILGARSTVEATREKEKQEEEALKIVVSELRREDEERSKSPEYERDGVAHMDDSCRAFYDRVTKSLHALELEKEQEELKLGRVLDVEKPEDRSLVSLATASLNFSVRWKQGKFIGAGAFGSVYQAVNMNTGSLMAVKEIKFQELSGMPNLISQIKEELTVMEMLHHPNIVEFYGIEVHRDKVYIFEEYCQGGSLATLLETGGKFESETIMQVYALQMLEGLAYLHEKGVAHRDIKPDNILLDHHGFIKFADFGASKILAKNHRSMYRSRRGVDHNNPLDAIKGANNSLTGTPMYMSPEVIKNEKTGSRHGAMDIWSLGCVVLEIVTGKKPWSNLDNEWAIMFHIGVATQHPPLPEPHQLSQLGISFIKDCLTIDPLARPTASELMDHPWMVAFREEELFLYDNAGQDGSDSAAPCDAAEQGGTVTERMLHAEEVLESQENEIVSTSMSTPSSMSSPLLSGILTREDTPPLE